MNADAAANFSAITGRYPSDYESADVDAAWSRMGYDQFRSWAANSYGRATISSALVPFPGGNALLTAAPPSMTANLSLGPLGGLLGAALPLAGTAFGGPLGGAIGGILGGLIAPKGGAAGAAAGLAGAIIPGLFGGPGSGSLPIGTGMGLPGMGPGGIVPTFLGGAPNPPSIPGTVVVYKQTVGGKTTGQAEVIDRTGKIIGTWVYHKNGKYWMWHSGRITRRMNVMNGKALSRANRRVTGFAHVAGRVLHQLGYHVSSTRTVRKVKTSRKRK